MFTKQIRYTNTFAVYSIESQNVENKYEQQQQ